MSFLPLASAFVNFAVPGFRPGKVSLLVNGTLYEGWKSVEISRSVKEMAGQFSLDVSERWSGGRDGPSTLQSWRIRPGDPCVVLYAGVPAVTGYVDTYSPDYDDKKHDVKIQGRSKTQDLVDSSAETDVENGEMREVSLDQVANKIAKPHGVTVKIEAKIKDRFDVVRVVPGETKHEFLERYARPGAVALTDDAEGNLRLLHVEHGGPIANLVEGVNILKASATLRADNRYSDYEVKGQDHGNDQRFGKEVAEVHAKVKDGAVKRYRPFVVNNETKTSRKDARNRAQWEGSARSGESTKAEVTVVDWFCGVGKLWTPGDKVLLVSPMLAINRVLAIEAVQFQQSDDSGTITNLTLVPVEALNPQAGGGSAAGSEGSDAAWLSTKPTTAAV